MNYMIVWFLDSRPSYFSGFSLNRNFVYWTLGKEDGLVFKKKSAFRLWDHIVYGYGWDSEMSYPLKVKKEVNCIYTLKGKLKLVGHVPHTELRFKKGVNQ